MENKLKTCVIGPMEYEHLAVELIYHDGQPWAELNQESGRLTLQVFARQMDFDLEFDFDMLLTQLNEARERIS